MPYYIYKTCETCGGDGIAPIAVGGPGGGDVTCWNCSGDGKVKVTEIDDLADHVADILAKCDDILDKCNNILEKVSE